MRNPTMQTDRELSPRFCSASMKIISVVLLFLCLPLAYCQTQTTCTNRIVNFQGSCVNISDSSCGIFYDHSHFPNMITPSALQAEAILSSYLRFFGGTADDCSQYAQLFVCLSVFPKCEPTPARLKPPCSSLCRKVLDVCRNIPLNLDVSCLFNCTRYPQTGDCIGLDDPLVQGLAPSTTPSTVNETRGPENSTATPTGVSNETSDACPAPENSYFGQAEREFATGWLAFWATFCFLSTLVTFLTFLLDPSRFHYPWRPVIYLALAFNIHTIGYFFSLILGRTLVTCPRNKFITISIAWDWSHIPCLLVFGLLYYSMVAAFLWWLILSFSWFLTSVFKWSNESVGRLALFFHIIAWVLPLLMTISLMAARVVSGDELTATCFIVRDETDSSFLALLIGVIIPLAIFLVTGVVFLVVGFISILKIHSFMRHGGKEKESMILEKLMIRIGVFVSVYIIPAAVVIGCFIYELQSRPTWMAVGTCSDCARPNTAIFMVRICMFLIIGVLTGIWIWSKKTLQSWLSLPQRIRNCCGHEQEEEDKPSNEVALPPYTTGIYNDMTDYADSA